MFQHDLRRNPRLATAFSTFVCAWALVMASLALSSTPRADATGAPRIALAADATR